LVGGSGLYLKALLYGFDTYPEVDENLRMQIQKCFDNGGIQWLESEIKRLDPVKWEQTDRRNPQRMMRILGILMAGGVTFDHWKKSEPMPHFQCLNIAPEWERSTLYKRIDERVDRMMAEGLEEEVRSLLPHRKEQVLKSVGYSELFDHFDGNISRNEAVEQITWWNHQPPPVHWIPAQRNILDIEEVRCFIEQKQNKQAPG
jgi:tRNA dimethylallyltransferase